MRQLLNVAYSVLAEGKDDDALERLDIAIGMAEDPAEEAVQALKAHQEAIGLRFEDPDAPVTAPDDGTPGWMTRDQEF